MIIKLETSLIYKQNKINRRVLFTYVELLLKKTLQFSRQMWIYRELKNKKLSYLVIPSCSVCNFLTLIVDCSPPINDKVCNYINYPHFASKESKTSALNSCNLSKGFMQIKAGSISSIVTSQYGINMFHSIPSEMGFQRPIVLTIDPIQSALLK